MIYQRDNDYSKVERQWDGTLVRYAPEKSVYRALYASELEDFYSDADTLERDGWSETLDLGTLCVGDQVECKSPRLYGSDQESETSVRTILTADGVGPLRTYTLSLPDKDQTRASMALTVSDLRASKYACYRPVSYKEVDKVKLGGALFDYDQVEQALKRAKSRYRFIERFD